MNVFMQAGLEITVWLALPSGHKPPSFPIVSSMEIPEGARRVKGTRLKHIPGEEDLREVINSYAFFNYHVLRKDVDFAVVEGRMGPDMGIEYSLVALYKESQRS